MKSGLPLFFAGFPEASKILVPQPVVMFSDCPLAQDPDCSALDRSIESDSKQVHFILESSVPQLRVAGGLSLPFSPHLPISFPSHYLIFRSSLPLSLPLFLSLSSPLSCRCLSPS